MRYSPVGATGTKEEFNQSWYSAQKFGNPTNYGFHDGEDINKLTGGDTDLGQEIKAIANGTMVYYHFSSHANSNFGRHSVYRIDGPWGSRWVHQAHMTDQDFKTSGSVTEGQIIGRIGKSGTPYAHLHWAIFKADPIAFGIDNVPNNLTELNQIWEDPFAFTTQWSQAPVTPPVTDQSKYDFGDGFGIMELQAARSVMQAQKNDINNLRSRIDNAKQALG